MKNFKKTLSMLLCVLMLLSVLPIGLSAQETEESGLEGWSTVSAKFSTRTGFVIYKDSENGEIPDTQGFEYSVTENDGIKVVTPTYEVLPGCYGTSMIKSDFSTALAGFSVEIMPDEFDFAVNKNGFGNEFSIVWSNKPLKVIEYYNEETEYYNDASMLVGKGFRNLLPEGSQALCITIGNTNPEGSALIASNVTITCYDGDFIDPVTNEPGNRWVFTQKDDTHSYESIDISEGLRVSIRENDTYGYIVNINGKDYYRAEDVAYFNGGEGCDVDLSGLTGNGYVTVGAVAGSDYCNYTVTKVNNINAAEWQGQYLLPEFDNWTLQAAKFSRITKLIIAPGGEIKSEGFTGDVVDGALQVNTPDYDTFGGAFGTSVVTSKYRTPLNGLNVVIEPVDFDFTLNDLGTANHISVIWSEKKPLEFNTDLYSSDFAYDGLRGILNTEGKGLVVDISNRNTGVENSLIGSDVRIIYYDGSYISPRDGQAGYRWTFTDANIDITDGLNINVRADNEYGFTVNINGVDFCTEEDADYFDENIGAKVDLNGLCDASKGYISVGAVCAQDKKETDIPCNYRIVSVNGIDAADWRGESEYPYFDNWDLATAKFSTATGEIIAPKGVLKTGGFKGTEIDGAVKITTPDYETFSGSYGTTLLTSKNTTPLAGLEVFVEADDINFETNAFGLSDHISLIWSEGKPMSFSTEMTSDGLAVDGMRAMINKDGGKALVVDITNMVPGNKLIASQLRITYYDGSYICDADSRAGYRWIFADANVDVTNGIDIKVRCDGEYGFVVTVNGVDFCAAENVTYFDENIGTKVDLTGLLDAGNGYVTVGTVSAHKDVEYNHSVVSVNGIAAADWKGDRTSPAASAEGITVKVENLHNIRDFFIAKGEYTSYSNVKANQTVRVSAERVGYNTEYSYNVPTPGMYTVYVRYADGDYKVLYVDVKVAEPTFSVDGLRLTLGNLDDIKVVRTAYGEYNKVADIKRAEGARAFTAKYITDPDNYIVQYRENGIVTVAVCYNNGYTVIEHFEITKKSPEFTQEGDTVTFTGLDDLKVIRYAKGEFATSSEIKKAPGSVALTPKKVVDDAVSIRLTEGTYTFCVQYNDESYNYYIVTIE